MKMLRIILVFLSFSMEIHVEAEWVTLLNQAALIQYPADCVEVCGYKTFPLRKYTIEEGKRKITLGSDTIILKKASEIYAFVSGEALFKGVVAIELPVGMLKVEDEKSLIYVSKRDDKYLVRTLLGAVKVEPKGAAKGVEIPQGYENTISGVIVNGFAEVGFPISIDANEMIYKWASMYDGSKKQFAAEVAVFKEIHARARNEISQVYTEISERMIASHNEQMEKEKIRREKDRRERAALQRMYERKVMGLE